MPTPLGPSRTTFSPSAMKREREEVLDLRAVDALRPRPVEVAERLEGADAGEVAAVHEAAARALLALDGHHAFEPRLAADLVDAREAAVEAKLLELLGERVRRCRRHRPLPSGSGAGRRSRARACARACCARASDGHGHRQRRRQPRLVAKAVDLVMHVAEAQPVARDDLGDGAFEQVGADAIEQLEQPRGRGAEVVAAVGELLHHRARRRHGGEEAVEAAALVRAALLLDERAQVPLVLDALVAIEGAAMVGEHRLGRLGVDDAHALVGRDDRERSAARACAGRCSRSCRSGRRASCRRAPPRAPRPGNSSSASGIIGGLVLDEGLGDGLVLLVGDPPLARDLDAPGARLRVEVVDRGEFARREEVVADVLDRALDAPFLVGAVRRARARLEAVVPGEREQRRVKAHGVALALEHRALQVVVEDDPRHGVEEAERLDVAAQKARHRRAQPEAQEAHAGCTRAPSRRPTGPAARGPP